MHVVPRVPEMQAQNVPALLKSKLLVPLALLLLWESHPIKSWLIEVLLPINLYNDPLFHTQTSTAPTHKNLWPGMGVGCPNYMTLCGFINTSQNGYATKALSKNKHQIPLILSVDEGAVNLNNFEAELTSKICWPSSFWAIYMCGITCGHGMAINIAIRVQPWQYQGNMETNAV